MKSKKLTIRLNENHFKILEELKRVLKTDDVSPCVKFCIEFTGAILSLESKEYSCKMIETINDIAKKFKEQNVGQNYI